MNDKNFGLSDFDYDLDQSLIANKPVYPKHASKMLICKNGHLEHFRFIDLPNHLTEKDLVIMNDSKVIEASFEGEVNGKIISFNLHKFIEATNEGDKWSLFAKPAKKMTIGEKIKIAENFEATILQRKEFGEFIVVFNLKSKEFFEALSKYGKMPIPPYIDFDENFDHNEAYQTIFAKNLGSVAAPTAGLHFTEEVFTKLAEKKIAHDYVTLHVGGGTFLPVRTENLAEHRMHSETCHLSKELAEKIIATKKNGGKIVAIGTTSLRILESAAKNAQDNLIEAFNGETDIFITPGFKFKIVDILLTNFHLPKSTLLMLVSAFIGHEQMWKIYDEAMQQKYRFFSYGDCCLLFR